MCACTPARASLFVSACVYLGLLFVFVFVCACVCVFVCLLAVGYISIYVSTRQMLPAVMLEVDQLIALVDKPELRQAEHTLGLHSGSPMHAIAACISVRLAKGAMHIDCFNDSSQLRWHIPKVTCKDCESVPLLGDYCTRRMHTDEDSGFYAHVCHMRDTCFLSPCVDFTMRHCTTGYCRFRCFRGRL